MAVSNDKRGKTRIRVESGFENMLFLSRWLLAPVYAGLIAALAALVAVFAINVWEGVHQLINTTREKSAQDAILMVLSLIDISLVCNLLLIVIFSGYENFVSKIDTGGHEDRPIWMGSIDFGGVKMKLIVSIVAISTISLLRELIQLSEGETTPADTMMWMIAIQATIVGTAVLMAVVDKLKAVSRRD